MSLKTPVTVVIIASSFIKYLLCVPHFLVYFHNGSAALYSGEYGDKLKTSNHFLLSLIHSQIV